MLEVFNLQMELEQIGQEEGKGLEHICYAPMVYKGETPTLKQCTVQSVFGYYGNDISTFNKSYIDIDGFTNNYLNRIDLCMT